MNQEAEDRRDEYLESWQNDYTVIRDDCTSLAESILAGYLLTISDGYNQLSYYAAWGAHRNPDFGTMMGKSINLDGAETNFLFRACLDEQCKEVAVTLDEHAGRVRSPGSIARDRKLMDAGLVVLNFSHQEVLATPEDIAEKISSSLTDAIEKLMADKGWFRGPRPTNVTPISKK